jgi:hypothetical protein
MIFKRPEWIFFRRKWESLCGRLCSRLTSAGLSSMKPYAQCFRIGLTIAIFSEVAVSQQQTGTIIVYRLSPDHAVIAGDSRTSRTCPPKQEIVSDEKCKILAFDNKYVFAASGYEARFEPLDDVLTGFDTDNTARAKIWHRRIDKVDLDAQIVALQVVSSAKGDSDHTSEDYGRSWERLACGERFAPPKASWPTSRRSQARLEADEFCGTIPPKFLPSEVQSRIHRSPVSVRQGY